MSRYSIEEDMSEIYKEYYTVKAKYDMLKRDEADLKNKIKKFMQNTNTSSIDCGDFILTLSTLEKSELDETKALYNLKSANLDEETLNAIIHTREYIDETKLQELIYEGLIDGNILKDCIIEKEPTYTLRLKEKGGM